MNAGFDLLAQRISELNLGKSVGRVSSVRGGTIGLAGLADHVGVGDRVRIRRHLGPPLDGTVIRIDDGLVNILPDGGTDAVAIGDMAIRLDRRAFAPGDHWIGRIIDSDGAPLDDLPLFRAGSSRPLEAPPPPATGRAALGDRLSTGLAVFNTLLPIASGQRMGLFAGSGVGKSTLLGQLARGMAADVVVVALIGERGREVNDFIRHTLGHEGLQRSVIVAETSDRPATSRRRCAWAAMAVAEHFRDRGRNVLLLVDSVTRFAEAHREIATASNELPALRGYPPSLVPLITALCERAGPGLEGAGTITAVFSVLVAGSDMDEPVADILRGVLDGHVVLDRTIAERGRFPAIDVGRSVSRCLPDAATDEENRMIGQVRRLLGLYERSETMIRAGLYSEGIDPELDEAVRLWPDLDAFFSRQETGSISDSFNRLGVILRRMRNRPDGHPG